MKNTIKETREENVVESITCDKCKEIYHFDYHEDIFELQEFHFIKFTGGYASVFGDMDTVECDICQNCLKEMIGKFCRIKPYGESI